MMTYRPGTQPILRLVATGVAILLLLLVLPSIAETQEATNEGTPPPIDEAAPDPGAPPDAATGNESGDEEPTADAASQESSVVDEWRDVLRFGIDSEVEELVETLRDRGDLTLAPELTEILVGPNAARIKLAVVRLFSELDYPPAGEEVLSVLDDYDINPAELTTASLRYLSTVADPVPEPTIEVVREVLDERDRGVVRAALSALGRLGGEREAIFLTEYFDDSRDTDLQAETLLALGDIGSTESYDLLARITLDTDEEALLRQYAADGLGRIGDERAVPVLSEVASDAIALVRAYAVNALGSFDTEEANRVVSAALRDSFWRTRVSALRALASSPYDKALDAIIYKAERDPERPVRLEAIGTLGAYPEPQAADTLAELYRSNRQALDVRSAALEALLEGHPLRAIEEASIVIAEEWGERESRVLSFTAVALSRYEASTPEAVSALSTVYGRLLEHSDYLIRTQAVRGITSNDVREYGQALRRFTGEATPRVLRQNATATLEQWGLPTSPPETAPQETPPEASGTETPPPRNEAPDDGG